MNKKDVLELRRRYKKESCTISRMAGCYVDANKHKVLELNELFLNLPDEEFHKFMDIAKKTMSGTIGNNILELDFPTEEENPGGKQQFLHGLMSSNLENDELLERLYDLIIQGYQTIDSYLILVFRDSYDIISRTNDNLKLDESEEVYEYILVSICPVNLSKPGLGYRQDEHRIGARVRDWVVGAPDLGFLFPAFNDHSANIHKVDYFVRDAKDSHAEFIEDILSCGAKRTATEQRKTFNSIVKRAYGNNEEKGTEVLMDIQESFNNRIEMGDEDTGEKLTSTIILDEKIINEVLEENEVEEVPARMIKEICLQEFSDETPHIDDLIDHKALEQNIKIKQERELVKEVAKLRAELKDQSMTTEELEQKGYDIILKIKPDKADLIKSEIIGEQKYVMIPIDEYDSLNVNGIEREL